MEVKIMSDKNHRKKPAKQGANLNKVLKVLKKIWMVLFTTAKVAIGAVSTVLLIGIVCGFVFAGILGDYLEQDILPHASVVLDDYVMDAPSSVYHVDENGKIAVLQELYASTDWKKADYEEIPEALINAAIAIEDKRFYEHQGVDWITTVKACLNMFMGGDSQFGGSTITQQLVKNDTGEKSVTVQRKVAEIFRAQYAEKLYECAGCEEKKLVWFEHGRHSMLRITDTELYDKSIAEFLAKLPSHTSV